MKLKLNLLALILTMATFLFAQEAVIPKPNQFVKGSGTFMQYVTLKFEDGSTITIKSQGTVGGYTGAGTGGWASEIIKGTGRFEGIKGTQSAKAKYLPGEKGEAGPKGYGEGTITYTLPPK